MYTACSAAYLTAGGRGGQKGSVFAAGVSGRARSREKEASAS